MNSSFMLQIMQPFTYNGSYTPRMAQDDVETTLALKCLKEPLQANPITDEDKYVNELRIKYRTFYAEFNMNEGVVMLPKMFADDFRDEINRYVTLVDHHANQFDILVEKINNNIYFTHGWTALRDFYNIRFGAWALLVYRGAGQFRLMLKDRFYRVITPPTFTPPMKFKLDKSFVPSMFVNEFPKPIELLPYYHGNNFQLVFEKKLTSYDVFTGFLGLPAEGFGQLALEKNKTSLIMVDECANIWNCIVIYGTIPCNHFKIGGEWKLMVAARRLKEGDSIRLGAPINGNKERVYFILDR